MKIKVNDDACIGCGACLSIAPDLFEMNDDGLSQAKVSEVADNMKDQANEAIESCPTGAINEE